MFKNLKIQWQIVIGQSLMSVLLFTFMWISSYFFIQYFMNSLKISSKAILRQQLARGSDNVFQFIQLATKSDFKLVRRQLDTLSMVYSYNIQKTPQFEYDVEQALNDGYHPIPYSSSFSYGIFGNDSHTNYNDLVTLSDTLTTFHISFHQFILYFAGTGQEQYYSINSGDPYGDYQPHSRVWYQNQMAHTSSLYQYSDPYSSYFGGVYMTVTSMIFNQSEIRAVSAIDLNMTAFANLKRNLNFMEIIVTTRTGLLAICGYYANGLQEVDYIYNETLTGFNISDFQQIYNLANNTIVINTCNVELDNSLCLNDVNGTKYNFMAGFLSDPDFILIAKIQSQIYTTPLDSLLKEFQHQWDQIIERLIITLFMSIAINMIASLILDYLVVTPIKSLKLFTSNLYYKNIKSNFSLQLRTTCGEITQLNYAFYDFINQSRINNIKSQQQYMVMESDYPKRSYYLPHSIYKITQRLGNYNYFIDEYSYQVKDRQKANKILLRVLKQLN